MANTTIPRPAWKRDQGKNQVGKPEWNWEFGSNVFKSNRCQTFKTRL